MRTVVTHTMVQTVRVRSRSEERRSSMSRLPELFPESTPLHVSTSNFPFVTQPLALTSENHPENTGITQFVPSGNEHQTARTSSSSSLSGRKSSLSKTPKKYSIKNLSKSPQCKKRLSVQQYHKNMDQNKLLLSKKLNY